jgi:hypothetical protein
MKKNNSNLLKKLSLHGLLLSLAFFIYSNLYFEEYIGNMIDTPGTGTRTRTFTFIMRQINSKFGKSGVVFILAIFILIFLYGFIKDLKKYFQETKEYAIYYESSVPDEAYLNIYNIETADYKELNKLSSEQLTMIIQTIYARNSFRFEDKNLKNYYMKYNWYKDLLEEFKEPQKLSSEEESRIKIIEELIKNKEKNNKSYT